MKKKPKGEQEIPQQYALLPPVQLQLRHVQKQTGLFVGTLLYRKPPGHQQVQSVNTIFYVWLFLTDAA